MSGRALADPLFAALISLQPLQSLQTYPPIDPAAPDRRFSASPLALSYFCVFTYQVTSYSYTFEPIMRYDLIVVGSGPAGQKAAIAAAKQNWRVLVVERKQELLGGVSLHTGTIPSKTIREAILHLTGYRHRDVYDESYRRKREITMDDLRRMIRNVNQTEWHVIQDQFARNRVTVMCGEAVFVDPHHMEVRSRGDNQIVEGRHILLAPGTRPSRPSHIPFNGETIFDSDEILSLARVPRSMIVVGGGVIGFEYAIMFATLGRASNGRRRSRSTARIL